MNQMLYVGGHHSEIDNMCPSQISPGLRFDVEWSNSTPLFCYVKSKKIWNVITDRPLKIKQLKSTLKEQKKYEHVAADELIIVYTFPAVAWGCSLLMMYSSQIDYQIFPAPIDIIIYCEGRVVSCLPICTFQDLLLQLCNLPRVKKR